MKEKKHKSPYAIETKFLGKGKPPWKGWKITRTYPCAADRDYDYQKLQGSLSTQWVYRIWVRT